MKKSSILLLGIIVAIFALMSMSSCESRSGKLQWKENITISVQNVTDEDDAYIYFYSEDTIGITVRHRTFVGHKSSVVYADSDSIRFSRARFTGTSTRYLDVTR